MSGSKTGLWDPDPCVPKIENVPADGERGSFHGTGKIIWTQNHKNEMVFNQFNFNKIMLAHYRFQIFNALNLLVCMRARVAKTKHEEVR